MRRVKKRNKHKTSVRDKSTFWALDSSISGRGGKNGLGFYLALTCLVLGILLSLTVGFFVVFNYVASSSAADYVPGSGNVRGVTLTQYIISIYNYAASIIGLLAVIVIIIAGYRYMGAMGNPQYIAEAKAMAMGAIAGLVLVILSYLILSTLNPATVKW